MADSYTPSSAGETRILLAGASVGLIPLLSFLLATPGQEITTLTCGYLTASVPFLFICMRWTHLGSDRWTLIRILVVALVIRLLLLLVPPVLSEDLWRYIWDGHHIWDGVSPYLAAPNSSAEDAFAVSKGLQAVRDQIGHPQIPTVYPPTAQLTFALGTLWGPVIPWFRCVMLTADLITITALWYWAASLERPPQVAALFAFAPLSVLESAVGAHIDSVGVAALTLGALMYARGRHIKAAISLVWAIGIKWVPALLVIHWLRTNWRQAAWIIVLSVLLFAAFYMNYPSSGAGLESYAHHWRANDGLFALIYTAFESNWPNDGRPVPVTEPVRRLVHLLVGGEPHPDGVWPDQLTFAWSKVVVGVLFAFSAFVATVKSRTPEQFWLWVMGSLLLLSPVVHPWYLLWVLPFAIIWITGQRPLWGWAFILWSTLICLTYLPRQTYLAEGIWTVPAWIPWLQYTPVYLVLVIAAVRLTQKSASATEARAEKELDVPVAPEDG